MKSAARKTRLIKPAPLLLAAALAAAAGSANAQLFRAYLSSEGSDANPCTIVAPCRLLPAALTAVAWGGEIWMLDSANYNTGPVQITKSVSIVAIPGTVGSVLGISGTAAITVTQATTKVSLRNLRIAPMKGQPSPPTHGIMASGPVKLIIEGGVISGFSGTGVYASTQAQLRMSGTIVRDIHDRAVRVDDGADAILTRVVLANNGTGASAMTSSTTSATRLAIIGSTIERNGFGVTVSSSAANAIATASVMGSLISGNTYDGLSATGNGPATMVAHGNTVTGNEIGITAGGTGAATFAASNLVTANGLGFEQVGSGTFTSLGTNTLRGNTTAKSGAISAAMPD